MATARLELAPRSDGARYRRVTLEIEVDGALTLREHEMGGSDLAPWTDDEEVTLRIAADDAPRLAAALAADILKGGPDAVGRLAAICEAAGVSCRIACWS